jgi:hypothetical protein
MQITLGDIVFAYVAVVRRAAGASATARPQALGQRPNRAEEVSAEALTQAKNGEDRGDDCAFRGGLSSLRGCNSSTAANKSASLIGLGDQEGATSSLPPRILPAPSD